MRRVPNTRDGELRAPAGPPWKIKNSFDRMGFWFFPPKINKKLIFDNIILSIQTSLPEWKKEKLHKLKDKGGFCLEKIGVCIE
jgi:hypothetical protein